MTDTGYYTYGYDLKARNWHRQTKVHQTLTLDGKNTRVRGKQLLWHNSPEYDAIVVQNDSYPNLTHRRSVWFVDKKFFVLLDEAIGNAQGKLDLHFQPAVGKLRFENDRNFVTTCFDDVNVLVWFDPTIPVNLIEEKGYFAWDYNMRKPRTAFALRHQKNAPAAYLTILFPYRGTSIPRVEAHLPQNFSVGADEVSLEVKAMNKTWQIGRNIRTGSAWCKVSTGQ